MRIASRCLPRQRNYLSKHWQRSLFPLKSVLGSSRQCSAQCPCCCKGFHHVTRPVLRASKCFAGHQDGDQWHKPFTDRNASSSHNRRIQPAELVAKLDKYLPHTVDGVFPRSQTTEDDSHIPELTLRTVDLIHYRARNQLNIELFEWMIENGFEKAAIWIIGEVLRKIAIATKQTPQKPPSNIAWPNLSRLSKNNDLGTVEARRVHDYNFQAIDHNLESSPSGSGRPAHLLLNVIWSTLGRLVVQAADLDLSDSSRLASRRLMSSVFLILGHIHNLGFMPDNIYAYDPSLSSTFVQRPPILHLTSSRILTSLSDATWRDTLSDAMVQATARGISLEKLTATVAGSRYNVRVGDMGPEVWLELILWCCVETDQRSAAVSIIRALQERRDNPWFAVAWNSYLSSNLTGQGATIDWKKVKMRTGGTVGSIEGYSLEKPLIDVPPRTISVEVVLAVVELCINTCSTLVVNTSSTKTIDAVQSDIADVIAFLEPHDLPPEYFDYLGNRFMFAADFETVKSPASLQNWASQLKNMAKLETSRDKEATIPDLSLKSVLSHSQFLSSIQQQALDRLIHSGDVHNSLQLFNDIQEIIDQNKFNSITEFLQTQPVPSKDFFSARPFPNRLEYVNSYGQVPYHRLASFLNLLSENNMTGMGQWLLYADEVDGAVIPSSAYRQTSMTAALLKFAAISQDNQLRRSILNAGKTDKRLPTVRFLRQMVNTSASTQDFSAVNEFLQLLRPSEGGGAGIDNIVHLAALLLRLEHDLAGKREKKQVNLQMTTKILEEMLRGDWGTAHGTFRMHIRKMFLQNVAHVLKVFAYAESSVLQHLAQSYIASFPSSNTASLPARHFNTLLSAMVDVYGSSVGKRMWILFCGDIDISELGDTADANDDNSHYTDDSDTHTESSGAKLNPSGITSLTHRNNTLGTEIPPEAELLGLTPAGNSKPDLRPQEGRKSSEISFNDPFFPETREGQNSEDLLRPIVITRPNMHTIRIIVGAAIKEQSRMRHAGLPSQRQDDILAWAYWMFKSITAADEKLIEQEIQQPVSSLSEEISKHLEQATTQTTVPTVPFHESKGNVSLLWRGPETQKKQLSEPGWMSRRPLAGVEEYVEYKIWPVTSLEPHGQEHRDVIKKSR